MNQYIRKLLVQLLVLGLVCLGFALNVGAQATVNLNTHTPAISPPNADLSIRWFKDNSPQMGGTLLTPAQVAAAPAGVYYVSYYSTSKDCYSPASKLVVATNTCPGTSVDLRTHTSGTPPSGSTQKWYKDAALTMEYDATVPVGASATYYTAYVDTATGCQSPASIVVVAISTCTINVTNSCPITTVNLNTAPEFGSPTNQPGSTTRTFHSGPIASDANKLSGTAVTAAGAGTYYVAYYDAVGGCYSPTTKVVVTITDCFCYKPVVTDANTYTSLQGITSLARTGAQYNTLITDKQSAWTILEAKTKGFVINRVTFNVSGNPVGIAPANFVEGMMVYDTTNNCLKLYTSVDGGTTFAWYCLTTQTCPTN
ncbi:hypothetical protein EZJ43_16840 [Pedobacter changchengzhani]|uniref:Ig-like domain-containing protein n=1 Tax=Pedobacter changchengzhani TaxID=2529274 RepID=A0A4R5MHL1_9SPHI|nr:hypothetical protein [Pedobacter changchengzhani]TDG34786.1 hypothetical protein EZJ43_16840 [Pedobacter changchengzhani]